MTQIVKRHRNEPLHWGAVAVVPKALQTVIDAHRADADWFCEPEEGGWLRELDLDLACGGCAYLGERRARPGEFTIYLQPYRETLFFKQDYDEVLAFLGLNASEVQLLTGQVQWSRKKRAQNLDATPASTP